MKFKTSYSTLSFLIARFNGVALFALLVTVLLAFSSGKGMAALTILPFTTNSTWICPSGVTNVQVQCWGAGGGSGASTYVTAVYPGGGGAGGSFAGNSSVPVTPGTVYTVTVGAGGTGGLTGVEGSGGAGGDSWFGTATLTNVYAQGGGGGTNGVSSVGRGGKASTNLCIGTTIHLGGNGAMAYTTVGGGGGGSAGSGGDGGLGGNNGSGGPGGAAGTPDGAVGGLGVANPKVGIAGTVPGSGAGGSKSSSTLSFAGAVGGGGKVVLIFTDPNALNYYSTGNVDATLTSSWNSAMDGSGTNPPDFNGDAFYVVQTNHSMFLSTNWVLGGNSGVDIVGGGALFCSTNIVSGTNTSFTLEGQGTIGIGSTAGLSANTGNVLVGGPRIYSVLGNFIYTGEGGAQVTGNQLPTTVGNVTLQSQVKLSKTFTVQGATTLGLAGDATTGMLDLNGIQLNVGALATAGTPSSQAIGNIAGVAGILNINGPYVSSFGGVIENELTGIGNATTAVQVNNSNAVVTLSGANTYSGATTIGSGTLILSGDNSGSVSSVFVGDPGKLQVNSPNNLPTGALMMGAGNTSAGATLSLLNDTSTDYMKDVLLLGSYGGFYFINVDHVASGTAQTHTLGTILQTNDLPRTLTVASANGYGLTVRNLYLNGLFGGHNIGRTTTLVADAKVTVLAVTNPLVGFTTNYQFDTLILSGTNTGSEIVGAIPDANGASPAAGGFTVLTKNGTGTWKLSGANAYTGNTTVNAGTLEIVQPTLGTNSTVTVAAGAVLQLDFAATNAVAALVLGGVSQPNGVYGLGASDGQGYLTGAGYLQVGSGSSTVASNPTNISYTVSGGVLTLTWPGDHLGWYAQSNSVSLVSSNNWFDIPNSQSGTNLVIPINPSQPNVFYRLRKP